jgi:glutaconate CoA-transferase, subunit A
MPFHLDADKLVDLDRAAAAVADGALVALGGGLSARLPMALVRELIRQNRRDLHVVGSAHGIDVDLLVAAGAVAICEESYVGFEQDFGLAPAYRRAAEAGAIEVRESCCATILAQLRAAEFGLPFMAVRGVKGSDIRRLHPEYQELTCPFTGETLVVVPPLRPDIALIHAPLGDRRGNLHLDQPYVLDERFAAASANVVATVEAVVSSEQVIAAGITIPAHLVSAVAEVPYGAHPTSCYPGYAYDRAHLAEYVRAATAGGAELAGYLDRYVAEAPTEDAYRKVVGEDRLAGLGRWSTSTAAWKQLFTASTASGASQS